MKIRVKEHKNRHQFLIVEQKVKGDEEAHKTNCMGNEKKMFRKIIANEIMKIYIDIKKTHIQQFTHARYLLHELMIIRRNISADLFFLKKK